MQSIKSTKAIPSDTETIEIHTKNGVFVCKVQQFISSQQLQDDMSQLQYTIDSFQSDNQIVIFTDGSCIHQAKHNCQGSIGICFPNKQYPDVSQQYYHDKITNQRTELYAIIKALEITKNDYQSLSTIIYTDSMYCCNIVNQWLTMWIRKDILSSKENYDLLLQLSQLVNNRDVKLIHVKAHQTINTTDSLHTKTLKYLNNKVDKLATNAYQL